jgi:hypothetical protein
VVRVLGDDRRVRDGIDDPGDVFPRAQVLVVPLSDLDRASYAGKDGPVPGVQGEQGRVAVGRQAERVRGRVKPAHIAPASIHGRSSSRTPPVVDQLPAVRALFPDGDDLLRIQDDGSDVRERTSKYVLTALAGRTHGQIIAAPPCKRRRLVSDLGAIPGGQQDFHILPKGPALRHAARRRRIEVLGSWPVRLRIGHRWGRAERTLCGDRALGEHRCRGRQQAKQQHRHAAIRHPSEPKAHVATHRTASFPRKKQLPKAVKDSAAMTSRVFSAALLFGQPSSIFRQAHYTSTVCRCQEMRSRCDARGTCVAPCRRA